MNRQTKELNKLKEELTSLENQHNEVKTSYDDAYNLYNTYCDSIKDMKYQLISLNKKYSKRWDMLYRGVSFTTFLTSSIVLTLLNVGFLTSLILSLVPTGAVLGGCIIFSDRIKNLPMFSSLINKMKEISDEKQRTYEVNEETKRVVSELCKELDDIKMEVSSKKEQISKFENTLYGYKRNEAPTEEVCEELPEIERSLIRKKTLL